MGYYDAGLNTMVNALAGAGTWIAFHTADPAGVAGANQTGVRTQTTWGTATNGTRTGTEVNPSIGAGVTLTHWSVNTTESGTGGGVMLLAFPLVPTQVFSVAGTMPFTPTIASVSA